MFESLINDFHWLRPSWLLLAPAASLLVLALWRLQQRRNNWQAHIDEQLLPLLLDGQQSRQARLPFICLFLGLIIAALAMAGPSWEKIPQPVHKTESALIIMLDLSPSMLAEDLKPSRIVRSRLKLIDLLKQRQEGLTALIVYAGESHVVTPLTDDTETIISLLPSLTPHIMPLRGSNPEMAADQALTLLKDAGLNQGELLLVTDGVASEAADYIEAQLNDNIRLSILGIGSSEGAPIPAQNGGFSKDRNGGIVISKLDSRQLRRLATTLGGRYSSLQTDNSDIDKLLQNPELLDEQTREINREFDTWQDRGPWLTLLLLPFALLAFRRGWILSIGLIGFMGIVPAQHSYAQQSNIPLAPSPSTTSNAEADTSLWKDLWQTRDQQAQRLLSENPGQAASTFEDPNWRASAHYQAGNFAEAAQVFSEDSSSTGQYNQGNALAKAGQLKEAKNAYQAALEQQQDFPDAQSNLELVEELLKQQEQQKEQNKQDSQDQQDSEGEQSEGQQSQDGEQQPEQQSDQSSDQNSEESSQEQSDEQQSNDQQRSQNTEKQENSEQDQASEEDAQQQAEQESKAAQQTEQEQKQAANEKAESTPSGADELSDEQRQAMEQWLRQVPDDPSGLIRRKFEHQYRQRKEAYRAGTWQPPSNQANERW